VQRHTDTTGDEVTADDIWTIFASVYLPEDPDAAVRLSALRVDETTARTEVTVHVDGIEHRSTHDAAGPVEALVHALGAQGIDVEILSLHQSSMRSGADAEALTIIEHRTPDGPAWVAGRDRSTLTATLNAVIRAANITAAERQITAQEAGTR